MWPSTPCAACALAAASMAEKFLLLELGGVGSGSGVYCHDVYDNPKPNGSVGVLREERRSQNDKVRCGAIKARRGACGRGAWRDDAEAARPSCGSPRKEAMRAARICAGRPRGRPGPHTKVEHGNSVDIVRWVDGLGHAASRRNGTPVRGAAKKNIAYAWHLHAGLPGVHDRANLCVSEQRRHVHCAARMHLHDNGALGGRGDGRNERELRVAEGD